MGSINAQRAAQKVSEKIRKGEKVVLGEILKEVGYSKRVSEAPQRVTETKTFQKALALEQKSILENLDAEIAAIQNAIARKNLNEEDYRTLRGALDLSLKNKTMLSGGAMTMNVFVLPSEVMARHAIVQNNPSELPAPNAGTSNISPAQADGTSKENVEHVKDVP